MRPRLEPPQPALRIALAGYAVLFVWVASLHCRIAWMVGGGELASSDPPAHFTSGVMVYDYLRTALGTDPIRFAEGFYVRYPKVAIGQWPPGYYAVQTIWYFLFGVSVWSAQWLSAATAAGLAWLLFRRLRTGSGNSIALAAALVFLAMPLVQRTAWQVMSDLLTGLFVFLAVLAFSDLLDTPRRWRAGIGFLVWSILAILTKGTAWALGPFVVLAPLLARRTACYQAPWYWGSGLAMAVLASLFFLAMQRKGMGYPIDVGYLLRRLSNSGLSWQERLSPLQPMLALAPPVVLGMAALGLLDALKARWQAGDNSQGTTDALVAAAWILSQGVFLLLLPLTGEVRALLPSLAPAVLLAARAMGRATAGATPKECATLLVLLAGWAIASAGEVPMNRVEGYAAAARAIPYPAEGVLILVSSDPAGEGAFIVERLVNDRNRAGIVLRAGQMLAESNWMGTHYRPLFQSADAVREHLKGLPVRYVVIDHSAEPSPDRQLLADAVEGDPADFLPAGRFPVADLQGWRRGELCIYENPAARTRRPHTVRVRLGQERGGRVLEYPWP